MTHLHTCCNGRTLEWRRNLLLRPWSWNRNLTKHTMREQGQSAAAGEAGEGEEQQYPEIWPRPCRPPCSVCPVGLPLWNSGPGLVHRIELTVGTFPGRLRRKVKWKKALSSRKCMSCLSHLFSPKPMAWRDTDDVQGKPLRPNRPSTFLAGRAGQSPTDSCPFLQAFGDSPDYLVLHRGFS